MHSELERKKMEKTKAVVKFLFSNEFLIKLLIITAIGVLLNGNINIDHRITSTYGGIDINIDSRR